MEASRRKKPRKFTPRMQTTLLLCFVAVVIAFLAMIWRLGYLNQTKGKTYSKKVLSQQTYVSNALEYKRGDIMDRNKTKLATSRLLYNVFIDPVKILSVEGGESATVEAITKCFDISAKEVTEAIEDHPKSQYQVILKDVSQDQVEDYKTYLEAEEERCKKEKETLAVVGVNFEKKYKRSYPLKDTACSVVGFASANNEGLWGVENQYNEQLNGVSGRSYGYYNANQKLERTVKAAQDGHSIVTTLDVNIQSIVEKKIDKYMNKTGANQVAALVMDPNSGEIYAMSSNVRYDLNNAFDLTQVYDKSQVDKWSEKEKSEKLNQMWSNFCVSYSYEPGSTYKPMTVAAALEENIVNNNSTFVCDGGQDVAGTYISCVSIYGHGTITLEQSLMESCNDVMMQLAAKMGSKTFAKYQNLFNMGERTGIDLPGETSGLIYKEDSLGPTELATCSFGQSLTVNMVQIASAFSSVINGGNYYKPHVAKQILDADGNVEETIDPILVRKTVSEQTSEYLREYLFATVDEGTGATAAIPGYSIGGKTGTAEKHPRGRGNYLVSFIGAAPMDDPQVVVYVIVDEPNVKDQAHSTYAQEVVRNIMTDVLPFLGVYKDEKAAKKAEAEQAQQQTTEVTAEEQAVETEEEEQQTTESTETEGEEPLTTEEQETVGEEPQVTEASETVSQSTETTTQAEQTSVPQE